MLKYCLLIILFFGVTNFLGAQEESWFYIRAKDSLFFPEFETIDEKLIYIGEDIKLRNVLDDHVITEFKKTFKKAKKENLKKTFFVISDKDSLLIDLLKNVSHLFEFGELITEEDKKIFEPNDYGLTSTIGENLGIQANLDYLDYLELPKAWYYTVGSPNTIIGISDAAIDTTNLDFKGKTTVFNQSSLSKGHGYAVASIAAGQGDNGYGVPGVCYNCKIYATNYGYFSSLKQLLELSRAGVKVINCSWVGSRYYQTAQDAIDEMFDNGTIIVAGAGNLSWLKTKGEKLYYPASYNHVISVSSGMYKYESAFDNVLTSEKGTPYSENIRGYVGRTVGFKDHIIKNKQRIYQVSITTLNKYVDILAPSTGVLLFNKYLLEDTITYDINEHTSNAAPFVTGTIGLLYSLYPCLPIDEVETIIKLTATNIDNIVVNRPYKGNYGAGLLSTGRAVKMVYTMFSEDETVTIENQKFSRWDFKLTTLSKEVLIQNQSFTEGASLELTSKNKIIIGENTILKPNATGKIVLKIDSTLEKQCELEFREGFPE